jgi:hypothetical protein
VVVKQVFQYFSAGFGNIVGSTDYYNAFRIYQLLGYHITISISVNKWSFRQTCCAGDFGAKVRKETGKKKMNFLFMGWL